jgi:hypothetical protein
LDGKGIFNFTIKAKAIGGRVWEETGVTGCGGTQDLHRHTVVLVGQERGKHFDLLHYSLETFYFFLFSQKC